MIELKTFYEYLNDFLEKFDEIAENYDHATDRSSELENIIDDYSKFITSESNKVTWEQLALHKSSEFDQILTELRKKSAYCVAILEKYRALKLLNGNNDVSDYFKNIESCIKTEFGSFQADSESKVLLIGSGSFPMTPLLIAQQTGAEVVGTDIDEEAITLGLKVVEKLGNGLNIRLEQSVVEDLNFTKEATHIIFSSTVGIKYEILEQLHTLTNENVVVVMRYGDHLKSLFNYPMKKVNEKKWMMVENILRPDHVFDIALYKKA
ncbi:rRNA methyltransferase [Planococcus antarcticus DSM 14505]|uniref:rRNA methyltransferase n=1 Tax=Planococcus antarcticus DSM 14505 TaxID=1185653 RepID=A0ABM6D7L9_9BACL|nr:nicotianamine synthase family protein [Planococcus antarcticus]ANU11217.1 rRNA methyltransferase [Planococcus antarcticus DSM 14505]